MSAVSSLSLSSNGIWPCITMNDRAEEAARYYVGIFKNSRIVNIARYTEVGQEFHKKNPGDPLLIRFELDGQTFTILNGGPPDVPNMAISFQVMCGTQGEIDHFWKHLSKGEENVCGWCKDHFGVWWQIAPRVFIEMLKDADSPGAKRAMAAMMQMGKLDIAALEKAYKGG